jgi:Zn-dependent oligopeptidase
MTKTKTLFPTGESIDGAFTVAQNYTVFRRDFDIDNDEVTTYEVKDIRSMVAIFYADFFPREKEMVPG